MAYSGAILPIFIEIVLLFDRQGAKDKLAQFLRHGVVALVVVIV